jgi:hypothetical protein
MEHLLKIKCVDSRVNVHNFSFNKSPIYTHDNASAKFSTNSHESDNSVASIQQVLAHDTGGLGWRNNVSGLILSVPTEAEYILKMMNEELLAGSALLVQRVLLQNVAAHNANVKVAPYWSVIMVLSTFAIV